MNEAIGSVVGAILLIGALAAYLWSIAFSYRDATRRGRFGILVALLVAFVAWPLGFLLWINIRPHRP